MQRKVQRKITSMLVVLCILLALVPSVSAQEWAVVTKGVSYNEEAGEVSAALLTVKAPGKYTTYAAVYEDNALVDVAADTSTLGKGDVTVTFDEGLSFDSETQTLKVFVWNNSQIAVAKDYTYGDVVEDDTETAEGFLATFVIDGGHATVNVSNTQSFDEGAYITEDASEAYARDGSTGEISTDGGQINFQVVLDDGYEIASVTAIDGTYTNIKELGGNTYRVTRITANTTITITTQEKSAEAETGSGTITYSGTSVTFDGTTGVDISGTTATITNPGSYTVTGSLTEGTDGQLAVNYVPLAVTDEETATTTYTYVDITLNGVSLTNSTGAAFNGIAGAVTLASAADTENTFTAKATDSTVSETTAIYSVDNIEIKGDGTLNAVSETGNGIRSKEKIEIGKGTLNVTAGNNGIKGDEEVKFTKKCGTVTINSTGDGVKSDNAPNTKSAKKAARTGEVIVNGGTINITTGTETAADGTVSNGDGIQADTLLTIAGGEINIDAKGEALKASFSHLDLAADADYETYNDTLAAGDGCINITGGQVTAKAGEDGIKAVKDVTISGGTVTVTQALDGIQVKEIIYTDSTETTVQDYVEGSIDITNGTVNVTASEDGIQCGTGNITISGGDITVNSTQDGIQAEYVLNISDGTVNVKTNGGSPATVTTQGDSNSLADPGYSCKGLKAANLIYITGGDITLNTYDDAVHTNDTVQLLGGSFDIQAGDDGVHGDSYLIVDDTADIKITKCYEGLEAAKIYMNGGSSSVYATDDGINAAGTQPTGNALDLNSSFTLSSYSLTANEPPSGDGGSTGFGNNPTSSSSYGYLEINGGYIYVNNTQGDGIDANGSMIINGGVTIVDGATLQSEDGLDFDNGVTFNGGYVFTMTAGGMDSVSGSFDQKYLLYGFTSNSQGGFSGGKGGPGGQQPGSGSTGSSLAVGNYCIVDSDGNVLCAFSRTKSSIQRVLFSSPSVNTSKTYYIKPLNVSGATATDSLYGTVDSSTYAFTLASGCSVNSSGTSYTMTAN